jgi:hypothetical protein
MRRNGSKGPILGVYDDDDDFSFKRNSLYVQVNRIYCLYDVIHDDDFHSEGNEKLIFTATP